MLILLNSFKFVTVYWRQIALCIVVATGVFIITSWYQGSDEIGRLKTQLNFAAEQNSALQSKVEAFEKAEQLAKDNQEKSLKDREVIVTVLTKEINKLRTQVIPKDCNGAVAYGVKFKDDLQWPSANR
jgi:hypothetical protein